MRRLANFRITLDIIITMYFLKLISFLYQWTTLHVAVRKDHDYTVKCLVKKGADISIRDKNGVGQTITVDLRLSTRHLTC